jgi:hypothetical protein
MPRRILNGLLAAIVPVLLAAPVAAAETPPGGVYAIVDTTELTYPNQKTPPPHPQNGIVAQALKKPGVDGLLIHLRWNQISSSREQYDWDPLDAAIGLAMNENKRYEIGIVTGAALPTWVTALPPTGLGAKHRTFQVDAVVGGGCKSFVVAAPYDKAYLAAFHNLLHQLAQHLRQKGTYAKLSLLKLDGITTTTDELRLPAVDPCAGASTNATVAKWIEIEYTPGKIRTAWDTMLQDYLEYFPGKAFSIGFIGINAFPGITDQGTAAKPQNVRADSAKLVAALIVDAGKAMPGHLSVGFDSLTLHIPPTNLSYAISLNEFFADVAAAQARPGWQTNELLGEYPNGGAACGYTEKNVPVDCKSSAEFHAMLFAGIYPEGKDNTAPAKQGVYMELFPQNITAWPAAVRDAHDNLAVWNGAP